MMTRLVIICVLNLMVVFCWVQEDEWKQPRQIVNATELGLTFAGNRTEPDHFKLLERDGDYLLVGARDMVYNISIKTFVVQKMIVWPSTDRDVSECQMKGKTKDDCHNYIRVLAKDDDHGVLVCGTNAFKPKCRVYSLDKEGNYVSTSEFPGNAISPYDPSHNSTAVYLADRREVFSGTVTDFVGGDPVVYKHTLSKPNELGVRTERSDIKCLNNPDFVSSFSDKNHVYFWFREGALEYQACGKAVYSRVARVCKSDLGGPRGDKIWTSFSKARLNCSVPGDFPYYFDEIEATTAVISGRYGPTQTPLVYAIFNTPYNAIRATAVCAYSMEDIQDTFSQGSFKSQASANANWMPVPRSQVPSPRPGNCDAGDSRQISDEAASFMKRNPLMEDAIPNYFNEPLFVQSATKSRFTQIAVHPQVASTDGQAYDVIFVGTDTGKVLKMVNVGYGRQVSTVMVEAVQVFSDRAGIKNMLVYSSSAPNTSTDQDQGQAGSLVVVSDDQVRSVPLHHCRRANTCLGCVRMQDPYCAWDLRTSACVGNTIGAWSNGDFVQNVKTGLDQTRRCPQEEYERGFQVDDAVGNGDVSSSRRTDQPQSIDDHGEQQSLPNWPDLNSIQIDGSGNSNSIAPAVTSEQIVTAGSSSRISSSNVVVTQSQLAVAVVATLFVSLAVGFLAGVIFSNRHKLQSKLRKQKVEHAEKFVVTATALKSGAGGHHRGGRHSGQPSLVYVGGGGSGSGSGSGGKGHPPAPPPPPINAFEATPKFTANKETGGEVEITLSQSLDYGDNSMIGDNNYNDCNNCYTLPKDYKVKKVYL